MEYKTIKLELDGAVATIVLNRPEVLNALNSQMLDELRQCLDELKQHAELKACILVGAGGKAFVAGADIKELSSLGPFGASAFSAKGEDVKQKMDELGVPFIAAVNGFALGGGCELAMSCDMIIASDDAKFGQPEINLGIIPGFGGTQRLARLAGKAMAAELILTGDPITAQQAKGIGLVTRVVEKDKLMDEARSVAAKIASKSKTAIMMAKRAIDYGIETDLRTALEIERDAFAVLFSTEDHAEGLKAFMEKRKPVFKDR
ncbi:MAG: enoyl-CoA hydratase-related protein [Deltaproteobacteria bacterium]|nr:enoyl-CoA hydratase-related protein [Deltaproteobacteria bacterium]MCL5276176.1 enoyl-CoA hydratase-related protein [Deltaproteobacteria bacterium]